MVAASSSVIKLSGVLSELSKSEAAPPTIGTIDSERRGQSVESVVN